MEQGKISRFLEKGQLRQALEVLLPLVKKRDKALYCDLVVLSACYGDSERAYILQQISFDYWMQIKGKIIRGIWYVLQQMPELETEDSG